MRIRGVDVLVRLQRRAQEHLDPRLGVAAGNFGLERDPLGILRYSVLTFELDEATEQHLLTTFLGDRFATWDQSPTNQRIKLASVVSGAFLDRFRSFRRNDVIEPFGFDPLAYMRYRDDSTFEETRLYGGGMTLPPAGMSEPSLSAFKTTLASGEEPPSWRLGILDALRTAKRGLAAPALIVALGALETEFNTYFASEWRGTSRKTTREAADELGSTKRNLKTIEDVLRDGDLRQKIAAYVSRQSLDANWEIGLSLTIDARNDAVHGGIQVPTRIALRHIQAIGTFLEEQHAVISHVPPPRRSRVLDAFEEATNSAPPVNLERVVDQYLVPHGLDIIVYSDSASRPKGPLADEYGRTLVAWLPLLDSTTTPDKLALMLSRMAIAFSLRYLGRIPRARVGDIPFDDWSGGFSAIAWTLTHAVWEIGIDKFLEAEGMATAISSDIDNRATAIRRRFSPPYEEPAPRSAAEYTAHVELARVAAVVSRNRQTRLIEHVSRVAPHVADRARACLELLGRVDLEDAESVRDSLVCLHDRSPMLLASVVIAEPEAGLLHGNGLTPNPQPIP
jgi:hypothetical protein